MQDWTISWNWTFDLTRDNPLQHINLVDLLHIDVLHTLHLSPAHTAQQVFVVTYVFGQQTTNVSTKESVEMYSYCLDKHIPLCKVCVSDSTPQPWYYSNINNTGEKEETGECVEN